MGGRDVRTPVADAFAEDLRDRYPDMPSHLARGLGATYAAVVEARDTDAITQVRRENEMRDALGSDTTDSERTAEAVDRSGAQTLSRADREGRMPDEIARVVEHERAGNLSSPFADADQRLR